MFQDFEMKVNSIRPKNQSLIIKASKFTCNMKLSKHFLLVYKTLYNSIDLIKYKLKIS